MSLEGFGQAAGRVVVDLDANTPLGTLGPADRLLHPAALHFVPVRTDDPPAPDVAPPHVVPVLDDADLVLDLEAARAVAWRHRFVGVHVASAAGIGGLGRLGADFILLDTRLSAGRRHAEDGDAQVAAVVAYSVRVGAAVVATGVADQDQLDDLHDLGVDFAAGPHIDRRLRPGVPLEAARTAQERMRWLRSRLDVTEHHEDAAELVCAAIGSMGLLPSVYVERNGLLRCIAQRGYWQIIDGIPVDLGVLGRTYRTGEPQVVLAEQDDDFIEAVPGLIGEITVPLRVGGVVRAVLSVETVRPFAPGEKHEIARLAAMVEDTFARLGVHEADTAVHRLAQAVAELTALTDEDSVVHTATRLACDVSGASSALLAVVDGHGRIQRGTAVGPLRTALETVTVEELEALASDLGGVSSCISGGDQDGRVRPALETIRQAGGGSVGVFVVRSDRRHSGILIVSDHTPRALDGELREAIELLAGAIGRSLDHVRLLDELRTRAAQDGLTGVGSRAAFEDTLRRLETREDAVELAVLYFDLDGFKDVNDRLGHLVGDEVLISVAGAVANALRPGDRLYRVGGDEFAALVIGADLPAANDLAARIVDHTAPELARVGAGISIGVAVRRDGESIDSCIRRADADLYAGRRISRAVSVPVVG